ncbi:hypothetical protein M433DRAFT_10542 [Acidomyces richmondensis BFW]|nr:hypothetical protein M433DRAFT_10542 [Acidomyces richmondensis BFW]
MHDPEEPTHTNVHPDSQTARQAGLDDGHSGRPTPRQYELDTRRRAARLAIQYEQ